MINKIKNFIKKLKDSIIKEIKVLVIFLLLIIGFIMIIKIDGNSDIGAAIVAIYYTFLYFLAFFMFLYRRY